MIFDPGTGKKMKGAFVAFLLVLASTHAHAQQPYYFSQFFKVAPAFNPAFTGVDDYLDVNLMHRSQWGGFEGAPTTQYLGAFKSLRRMQEVSIKEYSLRISNPYAYDSLLSIPATIKSKLKHGFGGFVVRDAFGPLTQLKANLNYSFHYELNNDLFLAFGLSAGVSNYRLNLDRITLEQENDAVYNSLVEQGGNVSAVTITPGVALVGSQFYLGYSASNAVSFQLQDMGLSDNISSLVHHVMAGYQHPLGDRVHLQASTFFYYMDNTANSLDVNVKFNFNRKGYAGISYRTTNDLVALAGITLQNKFQIGYSYDMRVAGRNDLTNNAHEISLGLMLFNDDLKTPYLW